MIRINLTKKEIINSIYMQIGFSKKISETLLEDILESVIKNIIKHKRVKISKFGTFTLRKKINDLVAIQKLKKLKQFQREMLFFLNHLKSLKNI